MNKKKILFCSKIWYFITEIPLLIFLYITCYYNFTSDEPWKLIPLMLVLLCTIVFIGIYFFRYISISYAEIRYHGLFSPRDSSVINKDKTLILTMKRGSNLSVELFGNDGRPPLYAGINSDTSVDIYLFRGRAIGGARAVGSVLRFFEIDEENIKKILKNDEFSCEYESFTINAKKIEDIREIRIKFKKTI